MQGQVRQHLRMVLASVAFTIITFSSIAHEIYYWDGGPLPPPPPGAWIGDRKLRDPTSGSWCCNEEDCRVEAVREARDGVEVEGGEVVPYSRVIWKSEDGAWWRCRDLDTNVTRCLIGPPRHF